MSWFCSSIVIFLIGSLVSRCATANSSDVNPEVQIKGTTLQGIQHSSALGIKPVYSFRGIFYAEPPVGSLRFAPPVRKRLPNGVYDATQYGPLCPQDIELTKVVFPVPFPSEDVSEDCLHLDVYTPTLDPGAGLAVMVYYHGGAFVSGGGGFYNGSMYATLQNVVLVAANYRLGALGFLSTGDEAAFGNFGLLDQQMVLQWIHNHISMFGGDSNRITIFGESAGSVSCTLHLQSYLSTGFFHRAILQSGVAHSPIMVSRNPRSVAVLLAEQLNCPTSTSKDLVECLRTKSADEIVGAVLSGPDISLLPYLPVIDGFFIEEDPVLAVMGRKMNAVPELLIGINNHEGGYSNLAHRISPGVFDNFDVTSFRAFMEVELQKIIPGDMREVVHAIEALYGGTGGLTDETALYALTQVIGDGMYLSPAISMADVMTVLGSKVYFYEYQHRMSCSKAPAWVKADHGDEEASVFGFPFLDEQDKGRLSFTPEEKDLSRIMMTYWANFAKTGSPNGITGDQSNGLPQWPQYTLQEKDYMKLDFTPTPGTQLKVDKVAFWSNLMEVAHSRARKDEL